MTHVLIVDDLAVNRYLIETILLGSGHEVTSATNGEEALAKARENPPDIVVSDILMPVMDGFELCRNWKSDEALRRIPFVFFTATYTDPADEAFALRLGAERFLVKPLRPEVLIRSVAEVLEAHRRRGAGSESPYPGEDAGPLRPYNQALVHKLEKKVGDLETEVTARRRAAEEARALGAELGERLRALDEGSTLLASRCAATIGEEGLRLLEALRSDTQRVKVLVDALLRASAHAPGQE